MLSRTIDIGDDNGLNILVISGIHGNETHAVAATYELFKNFNLDTIYDKVHKVTFILNANEYGLEQDERENNYCRDISNDCNRLFPKEYKTADEIRNYIDNLDYSYDLILDVHNSPSCAPCVLIDYNEDAYRLFNNLRGVELYPLIRPTQIGTIKKYFNRLGWNAYTIELPQMGVFGNVNESRALLQQFIDVVTCNLLDPANTPNIEIKQGMIVDELYSGIDEGVIKYNRPNPLGEYVKDEVIAEIYSMKYDSSIQIVKAPYDGILMDVDENIYSYAGKAFGMYSKDLRKVLKGVS